MPSLKEVRTRIESVNSTKQITSAMKMVAAAKLRKSQGAITTMRPYAAKLREMIQNIAASSAETGSTSLPHAENRTVNNVLIVAVTSNRGLCGTFNTNIVKQVMKLITEEYSTQFNDKKLTVMCIGRKGEEALKNRNIPVSGGNNHLLDKLSYQQIVPLGEKLIEGFLNGSYDRIVFVYSQFKSAGSQTVATEQLLPVQLPVVEKDDMSFSTEYIFEPDRSQILEEIVPKALKIQLYKMLLDSLASENGARMVAMHKATDNAAEMLKNLKLTYNKARQAAITKEILEIVGGANALS